MRDEIDFNEINNPSRVMEGIIRRDSSG